MILVGTLAIVLLVCPGTPRLSMANPQAVDDIDLNRTTTFTKGTWTMHLVHRGAPPPPSSRDALEG